MTTEEEAEQAADIFQNNTEELGFVNRAQCKNGDLTIVKRDGDVAAALLGNHCVNKPQSTIYDMAVQMKYRRQGLGKELIKRFKEESPHTKIVAKCPQPLPSNGFYEGLGWEKVREEEGKKRPLNVWVHEFEPDYSDYNVDW